MLAQGYWFYLEPSLMWRKINSSMIMLIAGLLTAYNLLRVAQEPIRSFTGQIGWVHLIYAVFFAVRIAVTIGERQPSEGFFDHKTGMPC